MLLSVASAQPPSADEPLRRVSLETAIAALESSDELDPAARDEALGAYREALALLERTEQRLAQNEELRQRVDPERPERLAAQLRELSAARGAQLNQLREALNGLDADRLQRRLDEHRERLRERRDALAETERQVRELRARPGDVRRQLEQTQETAARLTRPAGGGDPLLDGAAMALWQARRQLLDAEIAGLRAELAGLDKYRAALNAERDLRVAELAVTAEQLQLIQTRLNARRREAAETALSSPAGDGSGNGGGNGRETTGAGGTSGTSGDGDGELASLRRQLAELLNRIDRTSDRQQRFNRRLADLRQRSGSIRQQLEIAGLNRLLGPALLAERDALNAARRRGESGYDSDPAASEQRLAEARLARFQVAERYRQLPVPDADASGTQDAAAAAALREKRRLLEQLDENYASYIEQLEILDSSEKEFVGTVQRYAALLDENLFWTANVPPVALDWPDRLRRVLVQLLERQLWRSTGEAILDYLRQQWPFVLLIGLAWALLLGNGVRLRRALQAMRASLGKVTQDRFTLTGLALLYTFLLALPWPLLHALTGNLALGAGSPLSEAFAYGMFGTAVFAALTGLLRQLCRPAGLAEQHLRWAPRDCRLVRRHTGWYFSIGVWCAFAVSFTEYLGDNRYRDTVGRLGLTVGAIATSLLLLRLLAPSGGALSGYLEHRRGLLWRARRLWYYPLALAPAAFAALALAGYYYSALRLLSRFFVSLWLVLAIAVLVGLALRWLRLEQRRVAWARARARREAILAARARSADSGGVPAVASGEGVPELSEEDIDLDLISEQSRGLLRLFSAAGVTFGLWLIWVDLLPALTLLESVELWRDSTTSLAGFGPATVTLGSLLYALAVLALGLFLGRNLPGLVEIAVLTRFSMDPGNRYALTTILRYAITLTALGLALNALGVSWDKAQWLVAALGVGLGFGLQEIFANFISGLILLLERPIRVGDTVTLGTLSGTVTRIRIRATSITDWDNREIIVPNKTFITEALTNWTRSDPITRVVIPVGVAYGSDIEQVHSLLLNVVEHHPNVLAEPAPAVLLLGFGDSALNFEIRVFVRELADRLPLTHQLHQRFYTVLRDNGIEIPFPQRDLHLRTVPSAAD